MKANEDVMAMNLRVIQRETALRNIEKIIKMVRFVVMAKYDEESRHWNYLKVKGPMFLVVDRFGKYRLVIMNHCETGCRIVNLDPEMRFELCRLQE